MSLPDPIAAGLARGWKVLDAAASPLPGRIDCDVVIVGTGAGGGITAELLARAGLAVVLIEEGPLASSRDFTLHEADAYPRLYQESAARKTRDKAITILQGRCVGGSTTVNWTSSFRTPEPTLAFWRQRFGLPTMDPQALAPWFGQAERRLGIQPWLTPPNENNDLLRRGALALGIPAAAILRNVRGCWNLGYCGMGCPTNAKQSMLVTTIPSALDAGARMLVRTRALRLALDGSRATGVEVAGMSPDGLRPTGATTLVRARHVVLAGGAIGTPALLLRSDAPDPYRLAGKRTFLHPTVVSAASFAQRVEGWAGAPQTIYTDHFLGVDPIDGPIGYKIEAPPLHPVLTATTLAGFGDAHAAAMRDFAHTHVQIALLRDGFRADSPGGNVSLRGDGTPELDYPITAALRDAVRRAWRSMAEIQFAAGARSVQPVHEQARPYDSWKAAQAGIDALPVEPLLARIVSAHVMGGCPMAGDERTGLVRADGRHWHLDNVSVHDGSIFPTSIGANPQLSIYGIVTRMAAGLAQQLSGRLVDLAA